MRTVDVACEQGREDWGNGYSNPAEHLLFPGMPEYDAYLQGVQDQFEENECDQLAIAEGIHTNRSSSSVEEQEPWVDEKLGEIPF